MVAGNEVKVLIYPQFRVEKHCWKYLKFANMIDSNKENFYRRTFSLIQGAAQGTLVEKKIRNKVQLLLKMVIRYFEIKLIQQ